MALHKCSKCGHEEQVRTGGKLDTIAGLMDAHPEWLTQDGGLGRLTVAVLQADPTISPNTITTQFRARKRA